MARNQYRNKAFITCGFRCFSVLSTALLICSAGASGKTRQPAENPQDEIQVVAHLEVSGGAVTRFLTTQHYRRSYLYAEREPGQSVTLIDVTRMQAPAILANVSYPPGGDFKLVAVTGNAALAAGSDNDAPASAPQTFRIMSFVDPLHPAVKQEFAGVTAMAKDDKRGLIFLANPQGIWILQQKFAADPQEEKEWEHMMLDAR